MTETQTMVATEAIVTLDNMPWVDPPSLPPSDLPDSDGEPMESPWHVGSGPLLKESYAATRGGGLMTDYYVGVNMFVYYSWQQVRNQDFKGPDLYFVHNVDGRKPRRYWAIWDEAGRYPDVVIELLSASTEREDLTNKRLIYEQTFRVNEYFCIAPQVERILGWRQDPKGYTALATDERGWMWSESLQLWLGAWQGIYLQEEYTWPRFYHADGRLVLIDSEAERERAINAEALAQAEHERAEMERERATTAEARIAQLEAELRRLAGT